MNRESVTSVKISISDSATPNILWSAAESAQIWGVANLNLEFIGPMTDFLMKCEFFGREGCISWCHLR